MNVALELSLSFDRRKARRYGLGSLYYCKGYGRIMAYRYWSRDCDCAESEVLVLLPADEDRIDAYMAGEYENAEGPLSFEALSLAEAREFRSSRRDRALEAYEDGHPYSIY